jgi:hypothetical protein
LLAVALVYAPLAGAVWAGHSMACCTGDHCDIPEHHHRKAAPADGGSHADCDHEGRGMSACSMSCCQDPDKPMVSAFAFVLPSLVQSGGPMLVARAVKAAKTIEISRTPQPQAPPPRFAAAL